MGGNKVRKHKISDANPLAAMLVNVTVGFILFLIIGSILEMICSRVLGLPGNSGYPVAAAGLIMLLLYKLWYKPEFEGALRGGARVPYLKLCAPILISWITVPFMFILTPAKFGWPTFITVGSSLAAGCFEEAIFRSFTLSTIMRKCRSEKLITAGLIISSIIFGVVHGLNSFSGADPGRTCTQIIEAGFLGLFLGALYLRCGNLLPAIIVHAVNDIIAMTNVSDITENGVITGGITWWNLVDAATCIIIGIIGLWMIRAEKRPEIMEIWSKKWKTEEI